MFIKNWKKEVFTLPNLLSTLRLLLIPVYMTVYLQAQDTYDHLAAGSILAISCLTDALDGYWARRLHQVTFLGKILDPLADKITQFTLTLCLSLRYPALKSVLSLLIVKELYQALVGYRYLRKGQVLSGALFVGKLSTAVLFITLTILVLFPWVSESFVCAVALMNTFLLTVSFLSYIITYWTHTTLLQDLNPDG